MSSSTKHAEEFEKVLQEVFSIMEDQAPNEFVMLNKDQPRKDEIEQAIRNIAEEEYNLSDMKYSGVEEIEFALSKRLPSDRLKKIKDGLHYPVTFTMDITKLKDGMHQVNVYRYGKTLLSTTLNSSQDVGESVWTQISSITIEIVCLVLNALGIYNEVSGEEILRISREIVPILRKSDAIQNAIDVLKQAFKNGSVMEQAKGIFKLLKVLFSGGLLWKIIRGIFIHVPWYEWVKMGAAISAMLIAALATDGIALIAKIALALNNAYQLQRKFQNLCHLDDIHSSMKKYP